MANRDLASDLKGTVEGLMELEERVRVSGRRNPNHAVSDDKVKEYNLIKTLKYTTDGVLWIIRNEDEDLEKYAGRLEKVGELKEEELEISHDIPNNLKSIEIELGKLEDKIQRGASEEEIGNLVEPLRNHCFNLLKEVEKILKISLKCRRNFMVGSEHVIERIEEADELIREINEIYLQPKDPSADLKKPIRFTESLLKKKYNKRKMNQIREELDQMAQSEQGSESFAGNLGKEAGQNLESNLENLENMAEHLSEVNQQVDNLIQKEIQIDQEIRDEIQEFLHEESKLNQLIEHIKGRINSNTPHSEDMRRVFKSVEMTQKAFKAAERLDEGELEQEELLEEAIHDVRNEEEYRQKLSNQSGVKVAEMKNDMQELREQIRVIK